MIRLRDISLPPEHNAHQLQFEAAQMLRVSNSKVKQLKIVRRSVDARKKPNVRVIYTIDVAVDGNEKKILARKDVVYGEGIAVRSSDGDLLSNLCLVEPLGDTSALFDGKFHVLGVCGGGGDGEHCLTNAGNRKHCALSGTMIKRLLTVGGYNAEGFDVGCIDTNVGDDADGGNQSIIDIIHLFFLQSSS